MNTEETLKVVEGEGVEFPLFSLTADELSVLAIAEQEIENGVIFYLCIVVKRVFMGKGSAEVKVRDTLLSKINESLWGHNTLESFLMANPYRPFCNYYSQKSLRLIWIDKLREYNKSGGKDNECN